MSWEFQLPKTGSTFEHMSKADWYIYCNFDTPQQSRMTHTRSRCSSCAENEIILSKWRMGASEIVLHAVHLVIEITTKAPFSAAADMYTFRCCCCTKSKCKQDADKGARLFLSSSWLVGGWSPRSSLCHALCTRPTTDHCGLLHSPNK